MLLNSWLNFTQIGLLRVWWHVCKDFLLIFILNIYILRSFIKIFQFFFKNLNTFSQLHILTCEFTLFIFVSNVQIFKGCPRRNQSILILIFYNFLWMRFFYFIKLTQKIIFILSLRELFSCINSCKWKDFVKIIFLPNQRVIKQLV